MEEHPLSCWVQNIDVILIGKDEWDPEFKGMNGRCQFTLYASTRNSFS